MGIVFCRLNRAVRALQPADAPRLLSQNRNQGRIEKTTAAAGQKLFSTYVLAQALFPLLKSRKKEEAKTREALIKGNLFTAERYFRKNDSRLLLLG